MTNHHNRIAASLNRWGRKSAQKKKLPAIDLSGWQQLELDLVPRPSKCSPPSTEKCSSEPNIAKLSR